jgi:hypothetical protein
MSSVVIAGNTSGSITLSAPAIAGTNTITLPAETGTLVTTATSTGISGSAITTGTVAVSVGGTGVNTTTAYGVLAGGTTATGAFQNIGTGTSTQVLTSNGPGVLPSFQTLVSGGQFQTQVFTTPGTWTKPSSATQVRVTVIGGGSGAGLTPNPGFPGSPGGTSSFGALISATGGVAAGGSGSSPGAGTVTTGTSLRTGGIWGPSAYIPTWPSTSTSIGVISGIVAVGGLGGNPTYSISGTSMAGAAGQGGGTGTFPNTGFGGLAIGICPVSAPVAVTVGTGGAFNPGSGNLSSGSGVGGAVVVEFVG